MRRAGALYYLGGNLLYRLHPFVETFLLTLFLSVEDFGCWSWAGAFYVGTLSVANGGIPAAILRYAAIAKDDFAGVLGYGFRALIPWVLGGTGLLMGVSYTVPGEVRWLVWAHIPAFWAALLSESVRAYLRARSEDKRVFIWLSLSLGGGLGLMASLSAYIGIEGAALVRIFQPVWLLLPVIGIIREAFRAKKSPLKGFRRFGITALAGNLAMEALFFLPAWMLGWRGASPTLLAYWRWATLLPFSLRSVIAQVVLYFYPRWARMDVSAGVLYQRFAPLLHLLAIGGLFLLVGMGFFWEYFPGKRYMPARSTYWIALVVGYLWSTEALLLPNLLSARGHIRFFGGAYVVALLATLPFYWLAGTNFWVYLIGAGVGAVAAVLFSLYALRLTK